VKNYAAFLLALLVLFPLTSNMHSQASTPSVDNTAVMSDWNKLVDDYFDGYFKYRPTDGTQSGFHQYDSQLEPRTKAAYDDEIAFYKFFRTRLAAFDSKRLPFEAQQDYELLMTTLNGNLLDLENIRQWETNPDRYSSGITNSAYVIMSRNFAPADERLRSLIAREKAMPAVFDAARKNLKNPPKVYTEIAIEQLPGIISFFQKDVPAAFTDVKDPQLLAEFKQSNDGVITALEKYQDFLKSDLLPISNGDFRIGAENYQKKLAYDEMVDIPLDRLLQIGYDDLHRNQEWFKRTAKQINPHKTPQQLLDEMQKNHPGAEQLLQAYRDDLSGIRQYIVDKKIVTIPSTVAPIVEETPPFMRALTFASMDTPGPYEKVAKEAYFNVTLPDPKWPRERAESYLGGDNRFTMIAVAIHEVYPGHYVQFLWVPSAPSKIRKLLGCGSNAEGWAHYSEQMMLDEGYGNGDPKLRLGQLQDALLRDARFIVGISMHTGKMTMEQAIEFFQKEGYQPKSVAEVETKRGTSDPTYLVYTLGKLEIMKLRADYRNREGANFNLQQFHDTFLKQGFPPIKLIRQTMLGNDSPVL